MRCGRQKLTRRVWTRGSDGMMNLTFGGSPHGSSAVNGIDLEYCERPLHDSHRYDVHGRLYRFVQVPGYECSDLSHESMIVNIAFFHGKDDRNAPGIRPRHFHDRPYGDSFGFQKIDEQRVTTGYITAISRDGPLRRTQQMLGVRVLEDGFLCKMFFSAKRRKSDDVGRKLALDVLPPIQSIAIGYSGQRSREKEGFLGYRQDSFAYGGHQQLQNRAFEQVWIRRDRLSCATLKGNRKEQHRMEIYGRDLKGMTKPLPKLVWIARAVVIHKEPHRAVTAI